MQPIDTTTFVDSGPLLRVDLTSKAYTRQVLGQINFELGSGERVTILGPSGSGKTTLLRLIAGLDKNFDGQLIWRNKPITGPSVERGLLFQDDRLFPWMNVLQNLAFALPPNTPSTQASIMIQEMLRVVRLPDIGSQSPQKLSGGMARRIALARALIRKPKLLLLDEPFSGVDYASKLDLFAEIDVMASTAGITMLLATHDVEEAVFFSDRLLLLGAQPTRVLKEHSIQMPRPRRLNSQEFRTTVREVIEALQRNADDELKQREADRTSATDESRESCE